MVSSEASAAASETAFGTLCPYHHVHAGSPIIQYLQTTRLTPVYRSGFRQAGMFPQSSANVKRTTTYCIPHHEYKSYETISGNHRLKLAQIGSAARLAPCNQLPFSERSVLPPLPASDPYLNVQYTLCVILNPYNTNSVNCRLL
jgi:hypothetical protein